MPGAESQKTGEQTEPGGGPINTEPGVDLLLLLVGRREFVNVQQEVYPSNSEKTQPFNLRGETSQTPQLPCITFFSTSKTFLCVVATELLTTLLVSLQRSTETNTASCFWWNMRLTFMFVHLVRAKIHHRHP